MFISCTCPSTRQTSVSCALFVLQSDYQVPTWMAEYQIKKVSAELDYYKWQIKVSLLKYCEILRFF